MWELFTYYILSTLSRLGGRGLGMRLNSSDVPLTHVVLCTSTWLWSPLAPELGDPPSPLLLAPLEGVQKTARWGSVGVWAGLQHTVWKTGQQQDLFQCWVSCGVYLLSQATPFEEKGRVWSCFNYQVVAEERNYRTKRLGNKMLTSAKHMM